MNTDRKKGGMVFSRFSLRPALVACSVVSIFTASCIDPETARRTALLAELESAFTKHPEYASDGFDFPVGPPDGRGYYTAQGFGEHAHLGEDWNGARGGNSDRGDPVHAAATGCVTFAADHGGGWGRVIRIVHRIAEPDAKTPAAAYVETLYAHFSEITVTAGDLVRRGQKIGTMGDAGGLYYAHLHFELRADIFLPIGHGYGASAGFLAPTKYIMSNRPEKK